MGGVTFIRQIVDTCIDTILPLRERGRVARELSPEEIVLAPALHELLRMQITTLLRYGDPHIADLVQSLKYDGSGSAARLLASVLAEYFRDELAEAHLFSAKQIAIVPVPLFAARERERGFNQIRRVTDALPDELRTLVRTDLLERTRATKQQTRLSRQERLSNVAGAFSCLDPEAAHGLHVYVIDDVTTTGATLVNAATPLRRAGASVSLLALARA